MSLHKTIREDASASENEESSDTDIRRVADVTELHEQLKVDYTQNGDVELKQARTAVMQVSKELQQAKGNSLEGR